MFYSLDLERKALLNEHSLLTRVVLKPYAFIFIVSWNTKGEVFEECWRWIMHCKSETTVTFI